MMTPREKFFVSIASIICIFIFISGIVDSLKMNREHRQLQSIAEQLLALQCDGKPCVVMGDIYFVENDQPSGRRGLSILTGSAKQTATYRYIFTVDGQTYRNDHFVVLGEAGLTNSGFYYLPNAQFTLGKGFDEPILYDPANPHVNMPQGYAKVLPHISVPNTPQWFVALIGIIVMLFYIIIRILRRSA